MTPRGVTNSHIGVPLLWWVWAQAFSLLGQHALHPDEHPLAARVSNVVTHMQTAQHTWVLSSIVCWISSHFFVVRYLAPTEIDGHAVPAMFVTRTDMNMACVPPHGSYGLWSELTRRTRTFRRKPLLDTIVSSAVFVCRCTRVRVSLCCYRWLAC